MSVKTEYDFIIVGSGPAGSSLAYGLAQSPKKPKVLVLEAGGQNDDRNMRVNGQRWLTFMNKDMNWGYKTVPQEHCDNRELDYSRGRGLGGSSAINFGVFTIGASHDYDTWAELVGDDDFTWDRIQSRFKQLVTVHGETPPGTDPKFAAPNNTQDFTGPVHVGYASEWEDDLLPLLDLFSQTGHPLNPDHNSGNPIGMSVLISSAHEGLRSTSADLLTQLPSNITVLTSSPVQRVLFSSEKKAIAVVLSNGHTFFASKEIILCAGALDTPRILMHSGIGPPDQLSSFSIPIISPLSAVGQNLRDHAFAPLVYQRKPSSPSSSSRASFYGSQESQDSALEEWKQSYSGPWAKFACEVGIGFFKFPPSFFSSSEFLSLPPLEQVYLSHPTIPHYEVFTHFPIHWFLPPPFPRASPDSLIDYSCFLVFLYNAQARGEVTLQSSDPSVPLRFDPKFLSHEFDRKAAVESIRAVMRFTEAEEYARDTVGVVAGPEKDATDEELLAYWRQTISSSWHMTGTAKMGRRGEEDAVVDSEFSVMGVEGLRVADMSVVPVLASCHVQAVAYVTGYTCAEKLLKEYDLL
ncbi:hypothetical protein QBC35DRAFT_424688 [Podospora australis]|uniref:Glucose-methanol-choline oxidoreductase N-terminal domain-containing protein n=1 Tax=Podospora australis TaxID=1536484 RepID=A0AAN6X2B6_9PEZI|nr:hypothetical protein QBC35DRAFT_424688 [Podospora australis]